MIQIFGLLFFTILICLIYLYYQGKISKNIPLIFMFFLILIIPFTYLENKTNIESFSTYDQIMNSSLDIFFTNQNSKERTLDQLKKVRLIDNPIQTILVQRNIRPVTLSIFVRHNAPYSAINLVAANTTRNLYRSFTNQNIMTFITQEELFQQNYNNISTRLKVYRDLAVLNTDLIAVPNDSFIIIIGNNMNIFRNSAQQVIRNTFMNTYRFSSWINNVQSTVGSFLVVLSKTTNLQYSLIIDRMTNNNNFLIINQNLIADSALFKTNGGQQFEEEATNTSLVPITNSQLINSKINTLTPVNSKYALSFTSENNESFVYLSSRELNNQVVLYDQAENSETRLDTQQPQFWSFEPTSDIVTSPLIVFIHTYSRPNFYLDAEMENGVMVLKASRFKAALRQKWELITSGSNYKIRHLRSEMYLGYSDFDGYLYKDDGSVFLSKSDSYLWNINQINPSNVNQNVIESFESNIPNLLQTTEVPADFGSINNPRSRISGVVNGKNIVIESSGRTVWEPEYSAIWNGRWIYHGTVESYRATLNINTVQFLIITMDNNGNGIVQDQFFNFRMNVTNAGANILTGIIPSGRYNGWRATLRLLPTNLAYTDPSRPFPVKMRYFIQQGNTTLNLSSGNINNMQGYSTKFVGDRLILANFMEASGIQTDPNLAFSAQNLARINNNIREQRMPRPLEIANRFLQNRIRQHRLLYQATINGWTANNFRQLSNNRGPTVTIATLQDGRFIGAYSPVSWGTVNQQYIDNPNAFLFDSERQYTSDRGAWGPGRLTIFDWNKYGPTFGGGHDFLSLNSWGNPRTLQNNVWTFMDNNNRGPLGVSRRSINTYTLRDLEVFSVTVDNTSQSTQSNMLYPFSSFRFTSAGLTGRVGPTLAQIRTAYSNSPWAQNSQFLNMTRQGIQEWRVPATGSYTIRAVGAGIEHQLFSNGIDATITTTLTRGEIIRILVGQTVSKPRRRNINSGGAGGTFVVRGTQASPVPIIIAGGGAGQGQNEERVTSNATNNNNGERGAGVNGGIGGSNGNGGFVGNNRTLFAGPGGGGLIGNGQNDAQTNDSGGNSFINGGVGGRGTQYEGGFGGGGGSSGNGAGGGGGGYSGGGGGATSNGLSAFQGTGWTSGGGGGSFSITGNFNSISASNKNNGFVVITANF